MQIKPNEGAPQARLPSIRPQANAGLTAESGELKPATSGGLATQPEAVNVSLSGAVRALAAALSQVLPELGPVQAAELLTQADRLMLVHARDFASSARIDLGEVKKLVLDLCLFRALEQGEAAPFVPLLQAAVAAFVPPPLRDTGIGQPGAVGPEEPPLRGAEDTALEEAQLEAAPLAPAPSASARAGNAPAASQAPGALGAQPTLALPAFTPRDEALARAILGGTALREAPLDRRFVQALLDPDQQPTHAVDFAFLRRLVVALSSTPGRELADPHVSFVRRDARAQLAEAVSALALSLGDLPTLTRVDFAQGARLLEQRWPSPVARADEPTARTPGAMIPQGAARASAQPPQGQAPQLGPLASPIPAAAMKAAAALDAPFGEPPLPRPATEPRPALEPTPSAVAPYGSDLPARAASAGAPLLQAATALAQRTLVHTLDGTGVEPPNTLPAHAVAASTLPLHTESPTAAQGTSENAFAAAPMLSPREGAASAPHAATETPGAPAAAISASPRPVGTSGPAPHTALPQRLLTTDQAAPLVAAQQERSTTTPAARAPSSLLGTTTPVASAPFAASTAPLAVPLATPQRELATTAHGFVDAARKLPTQQTYAPRQLSAHSGAGAFDARTPATRPGALPSGHTATPRPPSASASGGLTPNDRALLSFLYAANARRGAEPSSVDQVARALITLRQAERAESSAAAQPPDPKTPGVRPSQRPEHAPAPRSSTLDAPRASSAETPRQPAQPSEAHRPRNPLVPEELVRAPAAEIGRGVAMQFEPIAHAREASATRESEAHPREARSTEPLPTTATPAPGLGSTRSFGSTAQLVARAAGTYGSLAPPPNPAQAALAASPTALPSFDALQAREPSAGAGLPPQTGPLWNQPLDVARALGVKELIGELRGRGLRGLRRRQQLGRSASVRGIEGLREAAYDAEIDDPLLEASARRRRRVRWQLLMQRRKRRRKQER